MLGFSLYSALLTVDCGNGGLQTGWFFSDQGHILTAAHGFEQSSSRIGDIISVSRHSDRKKFGAKILEIGNSIRPGLDFAILQANPASGALFRYLPAAIEWSRKFRGVAFYGGGYSDAIDGTPTEISGKVISGDIRPRDQRIQLSIETPFNADGLSGCPILSTYSDQVFALQVAQPEKTDHMLLAIPLSHIAKYSELFREVVTKMIGKGTAWDIFQLDAQLLPIPKRPKSEIRIVYCLHPRESDDHGNKLLEYLQEHWKPFCDRVKNTFASLNNHVRYAPELVPALHYAEVISKDLNTYFDPHFIGAPVALEKVRCICDLSQTVEMKKGVPLPTPNPISHLVGISIESTEQIVNESEVHHLDCWFSLPGHDARRFASCLFDIIEDMLVDSMLFYSTRILQDLYNTPEIKDAFSKMKVAYANTYGLSPYGVKQLIPNIGYISFSSCCRNNFGGEINFQRLNKVWHHFVDAFLLQSLQTREKEATPKLPRELIFERIVQTPHIGGQINRRVLLRHLEQFDAEEGELCAVALIKKPARGKNAAIMRNLFRIQKLRPNRPRFCRQAELSHLLRLQGYLEIMFFRWRRTRQI